MKKLFAIFAVTAMITSCNDTATTDAAESDSARAAATADSLAAVQVLSDTATKTMDTTMMSMPKDSTKK